MKIFKLKLKAFTLIELLVVIAIIGILATISVIALQNARAKSRDAKRVGDIKQIQTALELYFNDKGYYPSSVTAGSSIYSTSSNGTTTYMQIIPSAPAVVDGSCTADQNTFNYSSADGSSYAISFCLGGTTGSLSSGRKCATSGGVLNEACAFVPTDVSNLKLWLKADSGITLNGSNVSAWADQSGNGFNAVQTTSAYQPLFVASAVNGKSALRFDGTNDYLTVNTFNQAQPVTIFVVWSKTGIKSSPTDASTIFYSSDDDGGGNNIYLTWYNGDVLLRSYNNILYSKPLNFPAIVSSCVLNYPNGYLYENGVLSNSNNINNNQFSLFRIGAYNSNYLYALDGDVAEIILYDSVLSDIERQAVENYLNSKYSLY